MFLTATRNAALGFTARTGAGTRRLLGGLGSVAWLAAQILRHAMVLKIRQLGLFWQVLRAQIRFTALDALPLTTLSALVIGGITLLQVYGNWASLGAETYLSRLLTKLVIRELGPLLVGVLVLTRSGTAIAAELATLKLSGELDTLVVTGVNPYAFLFAPRVVGGMVSVFCLVICFDVVALLGGAGLAFLVETLSFRAFLQALSTAVDTRELWITFAKSLTFGALIPLLCMASGLRVSHASTEIPQAVTRGAVATLVALLLAGALISTVFYA